MFNFLLCGYIHVWVFRRSRFIYLILCGVCTVLVKHLIHLLWMEGQEVTGISVDSFLFMISSDGTSRAPGG